MIDRVKRIADDTFTEVVALRRDIHQHPELATEEHRTSERVAAALESLGCEVHRSIAGTGVVAIIRGDRPGPSLMLRADMDALPILEATCLPFSSSVPGVMHACGHDAHTACLVGAAGILVGMKKELHGTVRLIFQPAEEKLPGGALPMIDAGVLGEFNGIPAVDFAFGQHVQPELPAGMIGIRSGMYMASADELYITIHGHGGHAAAPHTLQSDAVVVAAHVIGALQTVISRNCPPGVPSVLSIGKVTADGATNVIPETARMEGTFRAMDEEWRARAHRIIERVVRHTAEALGATATVEIRKGYPALYNHEGPSAFVREAAVEFVGEEHVVDLDQWFASEDFAYYLQHVPGAFYRLGTGNAAAGIDHPLHTSRFTIDEEALRVGAGFLAYLALAGQRLNG